MRARHVGVLSTMSRELPGYPFGSITPFAPDRTGAPLLLIAGIAQHTKNIAADSRVSLTVWEEGDGDPQAHARLTWIGDAAPVAAGDEPDARERYLRYFPGSAGHFSAHDFALYRIAIKRGRFIGGFGSIHWIEAGDLVRESPIADHERGMIEHMNADHADALKSYCRAFKKIDPSSAVLAGVDPEGFDVLADGKRVRFDFEKPVTSPKDVREAMVALAKSARA